MNPSSLDGSIQSALSSLFPPFEVTAPIVLSQLFRTIEERYHGDALHCLLDFLIPAKHVLESVQQAACAGYCDVVFRCEGWPLCLHDKTVIQLAPVNPLLLRPGDFYLQVEPFGDQAARIVLKSLLEEGCKEVEETPIPETSYPIIFTTEWLQEVNDGRHGAPLSRCLLCTDQGVIKLPWDKIATPEFLDKPKTIPTLQPVLTDPEPTRFAHSPNFHSSTLPLDMVLPTRHNKMSASSLRHPHYSSRVIKSGSRKSKPLVKPVGYVSPNTWDTPNEKELEGDYVDLVEIAKEREKMVKNDKQLHLAASGLIKAVRPPQPKLGTQCLAATIKFSEQPYVPCGDIDMRFELSDEELKCRYRESYVAALNSPVTFEKGALDLLSSLDEVNYFVKREAGRPAGTSDVPNNGLEASLNHCKDNILSQELCQFKQFCEPANVKFASHLKDLKKASENLASEFPDMAKDNCIKADLDAKRTADVVLDGAEVKIQQKSEALKAPGKHKTKMRSLSTVSDNVKGNAVVHKPANRSHSDIYPEMINSVVQSKSSDCLEHVTPKSEKRKSPKTDCQSSPGVQDPEIQINRACLADPHSADPEISQTEVSLRSVSGLLQLGLICLPGSRDRTGRAVLEVHGDRKEWTSPLVSAPSICKLLLYLHTIPRRDVGELGLTLVINSRKKSPPQKLYKALLMAQEQALHAVHSIVIQVDKDTSPRPEKQTGLQMDVVTSLKALYKTVESSQLTSEFTGSFVYNHSDWLQLHQRMVAFMSDLKGADSLLQKAIQNVEAIKKLDTAQDVECCIEEQKTLMMEVLKDPRLVMLQREGGSVLARVRKEEHRFPQSEDYRDMLESATCLYNAVEENLHALVMRSNRSLQQLESLYTLRETEANITETGSWLNTEAEQTLKDSYKTEETLTATEQALKHFTDFITQAKEKQEHSSKLMKKAEVLLSTSSESSPATEVFQTVVKTFKSNMADFLMRAERRHRELETLTEVYQYCQQASSFAQDCIAFLEQLETGCSSDENCLSTLQMYEDRLGGEFSTSKFQALKASICTTTAGRLWQAAWDQRQKVKQRLDKSQKKKCLDKTSADRQERREDVKAGSYKELDNKIQNGGSSEVKYEVSKEKHTLKDNGKRHSEADLTNCKDNISSHKALGRSLSEGSKIVLNFTPVSCDFPPLQNCMDKNEQDLRPGQKCSVNSEGKKCLGRKSDEEEGGSTVRGHTDLQTQETVLKPNENSGSNVLRRLQCILEELLSTEREYVKALGYVREHYFPELERPDVPQDLRGQRGCVFGNLEKLHDFHKHHFLNELENCVSEPIRVGRCFLRHKDSFALYALYSKNKPVSDSLLINHGKAFFKQKQLELGDCMDLWSYLLKPIQRISKYSLLLQDVLRECTHGEDNTRECTPGEDMQRAGQEVELEEVRAALGVVQFQLRHGNNLLAMDAIQHCDVNLKEQGQLIRQDEFLVTFRKKKCFRHVFLFQELILFSKTRKTEVVNETYFYKQSFKTSDIGLTQNSGDSGLCFEIWFRKRKTQDTYTLQAQNRAMKQAWTKDLERILWEQALRNKEVRMQERVFLGIGNKPFMDIQPSDAAINNRAVNCVLTGKEVRPLSSPLTPSGSHDALPVMRQKSTCSSSSSSSSSSGRGSLSPGGYLQKHRGNRGAEEGLMEDDLDQENGCQHLLLDSSESSGESVSGFSSTVCPDDASSVCSSSVCSSSVCSSVITVKHSQESNKATTVQPPDSGVGKSTEV